MAVKTKDQLKAQSNSTFYDNNEGQISPAAHRDFNANMIDSMGMEGSGGSASLDLGVQTIYLSQVSGLEVRIDPYALMAAAVGGGDNIKDGHILTVEVAFDKGASDIGQTVVIADDAYVFDKMLFAGEALRLGTPAPQNPDATLVYTFTYVGKGSAGVRVLVNAATYKQ